MDHRCPAYSAVRMLLPPHSIVTIPDQQSIRCCCGWCCCCRWRRNTCFLVDDQGLVIFLKAISTWPTTTKILVFLFLFHVLLFLLLTACYCFCRYCYPPWPQLG